MLSSDRESHRVLLMEPDADSSCHPRMATQTHDGDDDNEGRHSGGGEGQPSTTEKNPTSPCSSLTGNVRRFLQELTIEPMLFMKMLAEGNYKVVADTLEIERICRVSLNYTSQECQNMDDGHHEKVQVAVQVAQNTFNYYQGLMDSILPLLVVAFAGSYSDRWGRKPLMLAVMAGFVANAAVYVVTSICSNWPVQVLYGATFAVDITGSWVVFNMAVYSYVADITSPETRTRRLAIVDACWYLGDPLGRLLGGWLYHVTGFAVVFLLSGVLWALCFLYLLKFVPESVKPHALPGTGDKSCLGPLWHVVDLGRTAWKKRPGQGRLYLLVLLNVKVFVYLCQGHQVYLWARRVLGWGPTRFSVWSSIDSVVHQVGMIGWVWAAVRLGLCDAIVAVVGLGSLALWSCALACVITPDMWWLTVVATGVGSLEPAIEPALRTLLTVLAGPGEAGKILALNGFLEAAFFTVDRTLYTFLYNTFVYTLPQINFLVQAGWCLLLMVVLLILKPALRRYKLAVSANQNQPSDSSQDTLDQSQDQKVHDITSLIHDGAVAAEGADEDCDGLYTVDDKSEKAHKL